MKPEWCSEETWVSAKAASVLIFDQLLDEGRIAVISMDARDQAAIPIARALLEAEQRGRKAGLEEAAKVAERDGSSHEGTGAYNHDQTVQIRTADRIAAAIRAKANEVT